MSGVGDGAMHVWAGVAAAIAAVAVVAMVAWVVRCSGWGERTKKGNVAAEMRVFDKGADVDVGRAMK